MVNLKDKRIFLKIYLNDIYKSFIILNSKTASIFSIESCIKTMFNIIINKKFDIINHNLLFSEEEAGFSKFFIELIFSIEGIEI